MIGFLSDRYRTENNNKSACLVPPIFCLLDGTRGILWIWDIINSKNATNFQSVDWWQHLSLVEDGVKINQLFLGCLSHLPVGLKQDVAKPRNCIPALLIRASLSPSFKARYFARILFQDFWISVGLVIDDDPRMLDLLLLKYPTCEPLLSSDLLLACQNNS